MKSNSKTVIRKKDFCDPTNDIHVEMLRNLSEIRKCLSAWEENWEYVEKNLSRDVVRLAHVNFAVHEISVAIDVFFMEVLKYGGKENVEGE